MNCPTLYLVSIELIVIFTTFTPPPPPPPRPETNQNRSLSSPFTKTSSLATTKFPSDSHGGTTREIIPHSYRFSPAVEIHPLSLLRGGFIPRRDSLSAVRRAKNGRDYCIIIVMYSHRDDSLLGQYLGLETPVGGCFTRVLVVSASDR